MGGLVDALGPEVAHREVDPETGDIRLHRAGFNERNFGPRVTPCDQDFLRKLAKDTEAQKLEDWYNRHVATLYGEMQGYDPDGIFIGDGSYLTGTESGSTGKTTSPSLPCWNTPS